MGFQPISQFPPAGSKQDYLVNDAWNLLKENKQKMRDIEQRIESHADVTIYYDWDLEKLNESYKTISDDTETASEKLDAIYDKINHAQAQDELNPTTCFLFWCW